MTKKSDLSDDDKALFRDAMKGTKPLQQQKQVAHSSEKPRIKKKIRTQQQEFDSPTWSDHITKTVSGDDYVLFSNEILTKLVWRQMKNGLYPIEARLDLHGCTVVEARQALHEFIQSCYQQSTRHILIIHGKGYSSNTGAKLKTHIAHWLQQTPEVLAACSAMPQHGGTGALYVFIRSKS